MAAGERLDRPRILHGWRTLGPGETGAVIALGNFDGVHRGHRAVIETARGLAAELGAPAGAGVFHPHPRRYFAPASAPSRLMTDDQRARALAAEGLERIYEIAFDASLAAMNPEAFAREVLADGLGVQGVVTGPDFRFGKDRAGDIAALKALGERFGFIARPAPEIAEGEAKISSTAIREALQRGEPERAAALMERPFTVEGVVERGDQRGRTLGFPTANIALGEYVRPRFGVYAVRVGLQGEAARRPGVANIGVRPTVAGADARVEVYLFDFSGDLYGETVSTALLHFIRSERKFNGLDDLKAQIAQDSGAARTLLGA